MIFGKIKGNSTIKVLMIIFILLFPLSKPVQARIFHESLAATTDMAVLPGVLGYRTLRRTVQVRLGTNPAVPRDELLTDNSAPRSEEYPG
jgi:hypothetical protein